MLRKKVTRPQRLATQVAHRWRMRMVQRWRNRSGAIIQATVEAH
jgi:hypothetical protein